MMHMNRLFNQDQRTHEMVTYYSLTKDSYKKSDRSGILNLKNLFITSLSDLPSTI